MIDAIQAATMCSGIGTAESAWRGLGWDSVFAAEIKKFPAAVLADRFPDLVNLGDMTEIDGNVWRRRIDVLCAGTPCQAFSVAGLGRSLGDARGYLTLKFVELCNDIQPRVIIWENVPGILNKKDNPFGCFLAGLAGESAPLQPPGGRWTNAGYVSGPERAIAWRILDAQYFGLAQRRKRVFVIACPRDGADPKEILFEREGVRRDSPPSREAGAEVADTLTSRLGSHGGASGGKDTRVRNVVVAFGGNNTSGPIEVATALNAHAGGSRRLDFESETFIAHTLRGDGFDASEDGTGRGTPIVAFSSKDHGADAGEISPSLRAMGHNGSHANAGGQVAVADGLVVRRLTPTECERLQGYADGHTNIEYGRPRNPDQICPDGPRYEAIGNGMAEPVMRWIFERVDRALIRDAATADSGNETSGEDPQDV